MAEIQSNTRAVHLRSTRAGLFSSNWSCHGNRGALPLRLSPWLDLWARQNLRLVVG